MKKMFVLINHNLTEEQKDQALKTFGIEDIVNITDDAWSSINPSDENILGVLSATYNMINFAKNIGLKTIYATTKRVVQELIMDGKSVTKREFKHEKFREYL